MHEFHEAYIKVIPFGKSTRLKNHILAENHEPQVSNQLWVKIIKAHMSWFPFGAVAVCTLPLTEHA